jgi:hypothetical protein
MFRTTPGLKIGMNKDTKNPPLFQFVTHTYHSAPRHFVQTRNLSRSTVDYCIREKEGEKEMERKIAIVTEMKSR